MKLQVVDKINKISDQLYEAVPKLKRGQKVIVRLLNGVKNTHTGEMMFGGIQTINCHDLIYDPGTDEIVEIGIPASVKENKVVSWYKHILNGGGPNGLVGEMFELNQGNNEHEKLYTFLALCNDNKSNPNRDKNVPARFEFVDNAAKAKQGANRRSSLTNALNKHSQMKNADIIRFAAAMNWDVNTDPDLLREEVGAYAEKNPAEFLKKVSSNTESTKALLKLATEKGIIGFDQLRFAYVWGESGALIAKLQKEEGKDELELMAEWVFHSKNGADVFEAIKSMFDQQVKTEQGGGENVLKPDVKEPLKEPVKEPELTGGAEKTEKVKDAKTKGSKNKAAEKEPEGDKEPEGEKEPGLPEGEGSNGDLDL